MGMSPIIGRETTNTDVVNLAGSLNDKDSAPVFRLLQSVGANGANRAQDVRNAERALAWAGYYSADAAQNPLGIAGIERNPDFQRGVLRFQRDFNLKRDALMQPGGEMERVLRQTIQPEIQRHAELSSNRRQIGTQPTTVTNQEQSGSTTLRPAADGSAASTPNPPAKYTTVPTLRNAKERIENIVADKPARFNISKNPNADSSSPWYESAGAGKSAVALHSSLIEREARRQKVDPDIIKAIMYAENSRGHYFGAARAAEGFDAADSLLPMNIRPDIWQGLGITKRTANDPRTNIRAGVTLIKRIRDRIDNPTPEKIASIWNFTGREKVNDFGAYVGRIFREKPWRN